MASRKRAIRRSQGKRKAPPVERAATTGLPYVTAHLPGTGGAIKVQAADFCVTEIAAYRPCGHGDHVFFEIEKRGRTTVDVVAEISRILRRVPRDVGFAGMKDARAVTRQTLSVEGVAPERIADLELRGVRILRVARHNAKLKLGHLRGNRFSLKIRGCRAGALARAEAIVGELEQRGVPNYFGPQRFGNRGDNHVAGWAILRGDLRRALDVLLGHPSGTDRPNIRQARRLYTQGHFAEAARAWPAAFQWQQRACRALAQAEGNVVRAFAAVDRSAKTFLIQAAQSDLFNRVVAARVDTLDRLQLGDVALRHANGACFVVEEPAVDQPRCTALEISPTGPLFGARLTPAAGDVGALETRLLQEAGVDGNRFESLGPLAPKGQRRPLRVPLTEVSVAGGKDRFGPFLRLAFVLPPGSYATAVTREVTKQPVEG